MMMLLGNGDPTPPNGKACQQKNGYYQAKRSPCRPCPCSPPRSCPSHCPPPCTSFHLLLFHLLLLQLLMTAAIHVPYCFSTLRGYSWCAINSFASNYTKKESEGSEGAGRSGKARTSRQEEPRTDGYQKVAAGKEGWSLYAGRRTAKESDEEEPRLLPEVGFVQTFSVLRETP